MGNFWCCPCGICCDNTNACGNIEFSDNFSSALAGYTDTICNPATGVSFGVSGGFLQETSGGAPYTNAGGTHMQQVPLPPLLNGLCVSVSAQIYKVSGKTSGVTGVSLGGIGVLFGNWNTVPTIQYGAWNKASAAGCIDATGTNHTFGSSGFNFNDGDCLCLVLRDTSSGAGTYSLKSYVNGTLVDSYTGVAYTLTAGRSISAGVIDTNGGKWANLCVETNNTIKCCPNLPFPTVLHITFSNSGHCAALDGKTLALNYTDDGSGVPKWQNTMQCGALGNNMQFILNCGGLQTSCLNTIGIQWSAIAGTPDCVIGSTGPNAGCTCSPINLVYNLTVNNAGGVCQCCTGGTILTATVTL